MQTYPLTTAQNNILTMAQYYSGTALCNIGGTIEFEIEELNADIIEKTINILVEKMDGFRIRLCKNGDRIEQYFEDYSYFTIPVVDMRGKSDREIDEYVQSKIVEPIELFDEKLYRWTILKKDHSWVIVALMHHIIGDAWSFNMIAETEMNLLETALNIKGEYAPIIGRICMDQCMIDVAALKEVNVGDIVTVYGDSEINSIDKIAAINKTISYEIVCSVSERVPRIYVNENK